MLRTVILLFFFSTFASAMEYEEARHLLSRSGFGGSPTQIEELLPLSYEKAVQHLLEKMRDTAITPPPDWVMEVSPNNFRKRKTLLKILGEDLRRAYKMLMRRERRKRVMELKAWWYREMIHTPSPLTERMTLFWHNHFTSSFRKVKSPYLLYQQNILLRKHAKGNFRQLLYAISKDPAMILYLDNQTNRKGKPNENFARELLELFTLGEGNYTEKDIKEAARAFTGWMVAKKTGEFRFNKRQHDSGTKNFMGRSGEFTGEDILEIILQNPKVATFVTEKLWKEFISLTPNPQEVERLAKIFRENDYEIAPLLEGLFTSKYFRDSSIVGQQIKSPVELIVGTIRMFHVRVKDTKQLIQYGRQLGQDIFDPPNVKGWPGGKTWISSSSLLTRRQLLERGLRGNEMFITRFWAWHYLKRQEKSEIGLDKWLSLDQEQKVEKIRKILLPIPPVEPLPQQINSQDAIYHLVLDLSYQLK